MNAPSEIISSYCVAALYVLLLPRNMSEITGKIEEFETDVRQRTTICTLVVLINLQYDNFFWVGCFGLFDFQSKGWLSGTPL